MQSTPIHINGPFTLEHQQAAHVIRGRDGVPICEITGRLFDGSGRKDKYPDGVIRTETDRQQEAQWVVDAMNEKFNRDGCATTSQGCYPGCFYYTDSCFRADCRKSK